MSTVTNKTEIDNDATGFLGIRAALSEGKGVAESCNAASLEYGTEELTMARYLLNRRAQMNGEFSAQDAALLAALSETAGKISPTRKKDDTPSSYAPAVSLGSDEFVGQWTRQAALVETLNLLAQSKHPAKQGVLDAALLALNEQRKADGLPVVGWQSYRAAAIRDMAAIASHALQVREWVNRYNKENTARKVKDGKPAPVLSGGPVIDSEF